MLTAAVCDVFCDRRKTEKKRHLSRESTSCHSVREGSGLPPGPPVSLSLICAPFRLMLWILVLLAPLLPVSLHHVCPLSLSLVLIFPIQVYFSIPPPFLKHIALLSSSIPPPLLSQGTREQCEGISRTLLRAVWPCGGPRLKHARSASLTSQ